MWGKWSRGISLTEGRGRRGWFPEEDTYVDGEKWSRSLKKHTWDESKHQQMSENIFHHCNNCKKMLVSIFLAKLSFSKCDLQRWIWLYRQQIGFLLKPGFSSEDHEKMDYNCFHLISLPRGHHQSQRWALLHPDVQRHKRITFGDGIMKMNWTSTVILIKILEHGWMSQI